MEPTRVLSLVNQLKLSARYVLYNEIIKAVRVDVKHEAVTPRIHESQHVRELHEKDRRRDERLLETIQSLHLEDKSVKRIDLWRVVQKLDQELFYGCQ